jgi:hypothetical protein
MSAHPIPARQMEDIHLQVAERMEKIEPLRTLGNFLQTELDPNGVIQVTGPTQSLLIKQMVIQALSDIPGIQGIQDRIVADPDLELAVAWALAQDHRTCDLPPGRIFIRSHLGVITVFGNLPAGFLLQDIVDVVSNVSGVRDIEAKLRV